MKPNYASAHQWYSSLLVAQLRWNEAFQQIDEALELDPLSRMKMFDEMKHETASFLELVTDTYPLGKKA